jgi:hydroxyethylthiazole kinase-like uncharacterized protein yjeF
MQIYTRPPRLPSRPQDANKVRAGRVVIVGGSLGMAGAPALAALGAHRAGAGLVRIAVPAALQATVAGFRPESMTLALPDPTPGILEAPASVALTAAVAGWDVVVLGPGLGRNPGTQHLVRTFTLDMELPLVLDADGLFAWRERCPALSARTAPLVLTPHEGEAARLLGRTSAEIRANRQAAASELALASGAVVVLKGPQTLVADGKQLYVNPTGGPVLATGGTGDVLAGVIAALLATPGADAFDAACQAVFVHGLSADEIAGERDRGLLASELAAGIPEALVALREDGTASA